MVGSKERGKLDWLGLIRVGGMCILLALLDRVFGYSSLICGVWMGCRVFVVPLNERGGYFFTRYTNYKMNIASFAPSEKMTMKRYQRFNKFLMVDNEVGSDFADFNTRISKVIQFLKKGMRTDAVKELDNFRQMVYNSFMEYSPKGYALALLVHKIDGVEYTDITAGGLKKVLEKLEEAGVTQEEAIKKVREVKKK